jgi:glycosyltransferase involved in cell wall biosynthesis
LKIAVLSTSVFSVPCAGYSGLEQLAWLQAKGFAARGHEVALVAPQGSTCPGAEIIETGPAGQWDESATYSTYWHRLPEFDVILDNSWSKWAYCLKQEGKLQAPVLGVMHAPVDTMFRSPPPVPKPCIVCISDDQRAHYEALHGHAEARTCHNGVDMEFYKPIGTPRTDRYLFLARFSTIKGPDIAIEACLRAGVGLDLVGDTSITQEPDYFNRIKHMTTLSSPGWDQSKGRQIRLVGPATRGECVHWFSQAHALLHPNNRFREPFGLAPVEAMACGTPVIAWRYGAMKETVKHGQSGFLVSTLDEIVSLLKIGATDKLDRERCRQWAHEFGVHRMTERYLELFDEALTTGGW